jgi:hypothetical protein
MYRHRRLPRLRREGTARGHRVVRGHMAVRPWWTVSASGSGWVRSSGMGLLGRVAGGGAGGGQFAEPAEERGVLIAEEFDFGPQFGVGGGELADAGLVGGVAGPLAAEHGQDHVRQSWPHG